MAKKAANLNEAFRMVSEQISELRGEILGARLVAIHAMRVAISSSEDPATTLKAAYESTLRSLLEHSHVDEEGDEDGLVESQIALAKRRIEQTFEELARVFGLRPTAN